MKSSFSARPLFLKLLLGLALSLLLAACGSLGQAGPSTTAMMHTDGPVAPTPQPTVATGTMNSDYAFVKNGQVWLSLHGGAPQQATKLFIDSQLNTPFYNNFLWLNHDQYLAFTLVVHGTGLGCGGCFCGLGYYYDAQLFVLNTNTLQLSSPKITGQTNPQTSTYTPYLGYWNTLIKEDETHLLGWNTDAFSRDGSVDGPLAGLYELDLTSGNLALKIAKANMPNLNFFSTMNNMAYGNGKVYYEAVTNTGGYDTHFAILSHSLDNNTSASTKVADIGTESLCPEGATTLPADTGWLSGSSWAISPDGTTLAVQVMTSPSNGYMSSKVEKINLSNGQVTAISQSLTPNELYWDIALAWSSNGQNMTLLGTNEPADRSTQGSSILSTCNSQNQLQQYQMNESGGVFWQDNMHFLLVIVTSDASTYTNGVKVVQYVVGTPTGVQLPGMTLSIATQFTVGEGV